MSHRLLSHHWWEEFLDARVRRPFATAGACAASIVVGLALAAPQVARAEKDLVEIVQAIWTDRIDPGSRQFGAKYDDVAPEKPLYLWMHVRGNKKALARLEADGKLPIRHKWFRQTLTSINPEGVMQVTDNIPVPAARIEVLSKLKSEVAGRGYFNWRTWSKKENIHPGQWRVRVVYANNAPVACGANQDPCEFFIEVR